MRVILSQPSNQGRYNNVMFTTSDAELTALCPAKWRPIDNNTQPDVRCFIFTKQQFYFGTLCQIWPSETPGRHLKLKARTHAFQFISTDTLSLINFNHVKLRVNVGTNTIRNELVAEIVLIRELIELERKSGSVRFTEKQI